MKEQRSESIRKLDEIIAQLMSQRGYGQMVVADNVAEVWQAVVGKELSEYSRPGRIRSGVLNVFVSNSVAMQELTFRRKSIVSEIQALAPELSITDVKFRITR